MEEVDTIIIHSLQDIGCNINVETDSLHVFSTELIVEAAARCLEIIKPESDIPKTLPINMAARFQVGASIATACKELGYSGDVGYQTFLYANVTDLRKVFIFLIEKLPRESERVVEPEPDDAFYRLKADISRCMQAGLSSRQTFHDIKTSPFSPLPLETGIVVPRDKLHYSLQERTDYCNENLQFLPDQVPRPNFLPSIIALNSKGYAAKTMRKPRRKTTILTTKTANIVPLPRTKRLWTWLGQQEKILFERDVPGSFSREQLFLNDVNAPELNDQEKNKLELGTLKLRLDELQVTIKKDSSKLVQIQNDYVVVEKALKGRVKEYEALCKSLELLPNYEENINKIVDAIAVSHKRFESLNEQWKNYKTPVEAKLSELRTESTNEVGGNSSSELRSKLDAVSKYVTVKQQNIQLLQKELDQLPKNIIRSAYTRRIVEIIGNIKKQKDEIDNILRDTKELQRTTNQLFGTLDRLFIVVDETIFRNAKKDEHSKKSYKHLATLHADCSDIVRMVMETGSIEREIRDLQDQVDAEAGKKTGDNLERISADMRLLKEENTTLSGQLKL